MGVRPVSARRSKALPKIVAAMRRAASGEIVADTIEQMAPKIERAMKITLKPHRRTGAAEGRAAARAGDATITLENVAYVKYLKGAGGVFARRVPNDWVKKLRAALVKNTRLAVQGAL